MQAMTLEDPAVLTSAAAALEEHEGVWAPARRRLTLGLVMTITLVAFEALAISTVMPVVEDDLGGLALYGWVFAGFFLGNLLGIVIAGQAADRRGTAFPFAVGLLLFAAGLCLGGLAPTMGVLVVARVLQGVGAGAIPAVAYASVGRSYPAAIRPRVFAVFSTAWVVPGLIGPASSSAIEHALSWRAVFLALLPFVVLAGVITIPALTGPPDAADGDQAGPIPDRRGRAVVLALAVAAVLAALSGLPVWIAAPMLVVALPIAVRTFVTLVPPGTLELVPGMPAAVMVRGILTFAFFGADAFVSLTFQDVRDQPTWVAGLALTGATLGWAGAAWIQQRWILSAGPRRVVATGFTFLAIGIAGMVGALGALPIPLCIFFWAMAGFGIGMAYAPLSVTVLGLARPGREGEASSGIQLADVLGVALGTGLSGAIIALGESQGWETASALAIAFPITCAAAVAGIFAARRLPTTLPG
jgi:MFS family permease